METELLASRSSTSTRFLLPRAVRMLRLLEDARETVTRDDGLGDNCSLGSWEGVVKVKWMLDTRWDVLNGE